MPIKRGIAPALPLSILFAACAPSAGPTTVAPAPTNDRAAALRAHIEFLADDLLEGRGTGTRGYDIAARYSATQLESFGVKPGGDNGTFFQTVPLRVSGVTASSCSISRGAETTTLTSGDDFVAFPSHANPSTQARAAAVFAGFGIVDAELGVDSYAGLDVRGKIVVLLMGGPAQLPNEPRAHHSSGRQKMRVAGERGAVGAVFVHSLQMERVFPYEKLKEFAGEKRMTWMSDATTAFVDPPAFGPAAVISPAAAEKLFAGAGKSFEKIRKNADANPAIARGFELGAEIDLNVTSGHAQLSSANVVGLLPGSDPTLKSEVVVVTAHLDHIGIHKPIDGDAIYNGAQDNATGSAMVLEIARALATSPPRRSVLFLLVTAEEKGLVGSDYFARRPSIKETIVANINLDAVIMAPGQERVVFWGENTSSLGPMAKQAATKSGLGVMPDPIPEQSLFVRSDHYSFVKQGVPALALGAGFDNGAEPVNQYLRTNYHKPSDEVGKVVIDYDVGAKLVAMIATLLQTIGDADDRPRWNDGDFFGKLYGKN